MEAFEGGEGRLTIGSSVKDGPEHFSWIAIFDGVRDPCVIRLLLF